MPARMGPLLQAIGAQFDWTQTPREVQDMATFGKTHMVIDMSQVAWEYVSADEVLVVQGDDTDPPPVSSAFNVIVPTNTVVEILALSYEMNAASEQIIANDEFVSFYPFVQVQPRSGSASGHRSPIGDAKYLSKPNTQGAGYSVKLNSGPIAWSFPGMQFERCDLLGLRARYFTSDTTKAITGTARAIFRVLPANWYPAPR